MNNFTKIDNDSILTVHINLPRLIRLFDMFTLIIGICKSAKYPEDLEEIYGILDTYIPNWKNKDWKIDV